MPQHRLKVRIDELLEELASYAVVLDGPEHLADLFTDLDDYPEIDEHAECNYCIGYIVGAADALGQTPWELLDGLECELDRAQLHARWSATR